MKQRISSCEYGTLVSLVYLHSSLVGRPVFHLDMTARSNSLGISELAFGSNQIGRSLTNQ